MNARFRFPTFSAVAAVVALGAVGCAASHGSVADNRAPLAQKWLDRAKADYVSADVDDAWDAIKNALQIAPSDVEVRTWGGRIALARLEYGEVDRLLQGVTSSDARGLKGRAKWYAGDIEGAADELEPMLQDPEVRDGWAKAIAGLARRGAGRKPFELSGGLLAVTDMPHVLGTTLIVPLEIDGEQALAMIATGTAEVTLDSSTRKEPSWVSLRFGGKVEVKDVPAMVQDLSGLSRQMNAPIKALLGVNLLRHANVTFDFVGSQFVIRTFSPPPPPSATRIPVYYLKGGGMVLRSAFALEKDPPAASLLVDTAMSFPIALDQDGWKKAGVDLAKLVPVPQDAKLRQGTLPMLRLGAFDIPQVPGVYGTPIEDIEKGLGANLDGILGSGMMAAFRVTIADGGRAVWLEDVPQPAAPTAGPTGMTPGDTGALSPNAPAPSGAGAEPKPSSEPARGSKPGKSTEKPKGGTPSAPTPSAPTPSAPKGPTDGSKKSSERAPESTR